MSSSNFESVSNQGEFHARVPHSEPANPKWVKPGNERGNAALPTFHAETLPAGTAPKESTFQPNPYNDVPGHVSSESAEQQPGTRADAQASLSGSTDRDIYNRTDALHGRPLGGQEGREEHGAHPGRRKKEGGGLEGVGASQGRETVEGKVHGVRADRE